MPHFDKDGEEMKQISVWVPLALHRLIRAEGLNLSRFVRDQLEILYSDESLGDSLTTRARLVKGAREALGRQRQTEREAAAERERLREAVRLLRVDRDAARSRRDMIADALLQIVGDDDPRRFVRLLPENDPYGDRADDWDVLVSRVSRLCGAEIDSAEVAVALRTLVVKGA